MRKILIIGIVLLIGLYFLKSFNPKEQVSVIPESPSPSSSTVVSNQKYRDRNYTGSVEDAFYGKVQVSVSISGGRISSVDFLQYPNDRSTSVSINSQAMPYLKQEAISAQSAQVDIISGATQTSQAFIRSLQSALSQAS